MVTRPRMPSHRPSAISCSRSWTSTRRSAAAGRRRETTSRRPN